MANNNEDDMTILPGFESIVGNDNDVAENFGEGAPRNIKFHFDASLLPDAAKAQSTDKSQAYLIYVVFPSREQLVRGIIALTGGERTSFTPSMKESHIDASNPGKRGVPLLEVWEDKLMEKGDTDG